MIKSYIKIALRNIIKQKSFSIINIAGLAIGIACSILILLYVHYESSYDTFNKKADRTYRLAVSALIGNTKIDQTYSSAITFTKLLQDYPEVEAGVKILNLKKDPVHIGDKIFYESNVLSVDSTFYDIFTVPLIHGNQKLVLTKPNSVVLSKSTALKYFNSTDVVGKTISVVPFGREKYDFKVTGVSEDMPENSHFHYSMLISLTSFPSIINSKGWTQNNFISYLVLKKGTSAAAFDTKLKKFTRKYMGKERYDQWVAKGNYWTFYLQPLTGIHLNSDLNGELEPNGNKTYVDIFFVISIIILLIACINFMNLSTARSSLRAKEVGLRKVVGSSRGKLITQFLLESIMISYAALIIAVVIVECFLPLYKNFVGNSLGIGSFSDVSIIIGFVLTGLAVGLISGFYPAFVLSSFKPVKILKNEQIQKSSKFSFRNILIVFQFTISIFLIAGTIIIYQQLQYLQNKNLGFDKEQVMVLNNPGTLNKNLKAFKQSLRNYNTIADVTGSDTIPGKSFSNIGFGAEGVEDGFTLNLCNCDYDFAKTLKLKMVKGRFFTKEFPSDSAAIILNQKAVQLLGWQNPIGKKINNWAKNKAEFHVIGVVKDYNYESLHQEIRPMALFLSGGYYNRMQKYISVRLNTKDLANSINYIRSKWNKFAGGAPFEFSFLDKDYDNLYMNEKQTMELFSIFSVLAIFIACLGLLGLATFIIERKTKEIGIRKVLGATVPEIVFLLSKEFSRWILFANLIAWPLAFYVMNNWLKDFAYRININLWVFLLAGFIALLIALLTISSHALRAATSNPVKSLRYE